MASEGSGIENCEFFQIGTRNQKQKDGSRPVAIESQFVSVT